MSRIHTTMLVTGLAGSILFAACSLTKNDDDDDAPPATATSRSYSATASVGDFMTIAINPTTSSAGTIAFNNISTGESGTVPYTVNGDGSYAITDPQGHLVTAWEVPGFALVATSNRTGPNNEPSIITAITSTSISKSDIASKNYNYIQFRTNNGGMELGYVNTLVDGSIQHQGYWPYGNLNGGQAFSSVSTFDAANMTAAPGANALRLLTDPPDGYSYIFRTTAGFLAVDTGNGGLVCVERTATKAFNAANAGTYNAVVYIKNNVAMDFSGGGNGVETGTPTLGKGTVTITADGHVTVVSENNVTLANNSLLVPIEDSPAYYDNTAGTLQDPCHGMFTFQLTSGAVVQDVFVTFLDRAMLMSSYSADPGGVGSGTLSKPYSYFNGVALKTTVAAAPRATN